MEKIFISKIKKIGFIQKINKKKRKEFIIGVLILLLVVSLFTGGFGFKNLVINKILAQQVAKKTIYFINKNLLPEGITASLQSSVAKSNGLYEIKFKIMDQEYNSYISSDGKLLFPEALSLVDFSKAKNEKPVNIPKKDKTDAKLFVMSYCPYGNDAEEAIKPVVDLLGDKADIKVYYIVSKENGKYNSLHGNQELNQNVREICVQKYQKDKFWDFVLKSNKEGTYENIDSKWEAIAKSVGVDIAKIKNCQKNEYSSLLDAEIKLSQKYGAEASPTLVINDTIYEGNRTPNAYKEAICSGFKSPPPECKTKLSDEKTNNPNNSGCK